jgi:hypothetical protein
MNAPPEDHRREVPAYVALVRIGSVVAMSTAAAIGIFLLVGGWWQPGLIALALALPCFFVMRLVERTAEPPAGP